MRPRETDQLRGKYTKTKVQRCKYTKTMTQRQRRKDRELLQTDDPGILINREVLV